MNPEFYVKLSYRVRLTQNTQKERGEGGTEGGKTGGRQGQGREGRGERGRE